MSKGMPRVRFPKPAVRREGGEALMALALEYFRSRAALPRRARRSGRRRPGLVAGGRSRRSGS